MKNDIESLLKHFEEQLNTYLHSAQSASPKILEAARYSTLAKSKRLRPLLVYGAGLCLDLPLEKLDSCAIAVELMHTYSLIHDDLPAMDDDDMRRGQPSCHKQYDEATAILVGDALQGMAIESVLESLILTEPDKNKIALTLLKASGYQGMIAGQELDLSRLSQPDLTLEQLQEVHLLKTGSLLHACIKIPMLLKSGLDPIIKKHLDLFGSMLGLVFQIQDDYLDKYGENALLGKTAGSDQQANKKTFADFYQQADLEALIENYYQTTETLLMELNAPLLVEIVHKLKRRQW